MCYFKSLNITVYLSMIQLEILLDIWREVGERIEPPTVTKNLVNSLLPDPPQLKEMLTKEIQLLVKVD